MKKGFTIPELILTMGAIGIVAVLTIPTLLHNIRVQTHQRTRMLQQQKISQGITMLSVRSPRMGYLSTEAFVKDLRKYMQIMNYCDKDNLMKCWPYDTPILLNDGTAYKIDDAGSKDVFLMDDTDPDGNEAEYADDNVSFVTNNGIAVLINYNKKCRPNSSNDNRSCYVAMVDVNGDKGPNKVGDDIYLINARGFINESLGDDETAGVSQAKAR